MITLRPLTPYYYDPAQKIGFVHRVLANIDWLLSYSKYLQVDSEVTDTKGKRIYILDENFTNKWWGRAKGATYLASFAAFYFIPQYRRQMIEGFGALVLAKLAFRLLYNRNSVVDHSAIRAYEILLQDIKSQADRQYVEKYTSFTQRFGYEVPVNIQHEVATLRFQRGNTTTLAATGTFSAYLDELQRVYDQSKEITLPYNKIAHRKVLQTKLGDIKSLLLQSFAKAASFDELMQNIDRFYQIYQDFQEIFALDFEEQLQRSDQTEYENPLAKLNDTQTVLELFQEKATHLMKVKLDGATLVELNEAFDGIAHALHQAPEPLAFDYADELCTYTQSIVKSKIDALLASDDPINWTIAQGVVVLRALTPKLAPEEQILDAQLQYLQAEYLVEQIKKRTLHVINHASIDELCTKGPQLLGILQTTAGDFPAHTFDTINTQSSLIQLIQAKLSELIPRVFQNITPDEMVQNVPDIVANLQQLPDEIDISPFVNLLRHNIEIILKADIQTIISNAVEIDVAFQALTLLISNLQVLRQVPLLNLGPNYGLNLLAPKFVERYQVFLATFIPRNLQDAVDQFAVLVQHMERFKVAVAPTDQETSQHALTCDNAPAIGIEARLREILPSLIIPEIEGAVSSDDLQAKTDQAIQKVTQIRGRIQVYKTVDSPFVSLAVVSKVNELLARFKDALFTGNPTLDDMIAQAKLWATQVAAIERALEQETRGKTLLMQRVEIPLRNAVQRAFDSIDNISDLFGRYHTVIDKLGQMKRVDGLFDLQIDEIVKHCLIARLHQLIDAKNTTNLDRLIHAYTSSIAQLSNFKKQPIAKALKAVVRQKIAEKFPNLIQGRFAGTNSLPELLDALQDVHQKVDKVQGLKAAFIPIVIEKFGDRFEQIADFANQYGSAPYFGFSSTSHENQLLQACYKLHHAKIGGLSIDQNIIDAHKHLQELSQTISKSKQKLFCIYVLEHMKKRSSYKKDSYTLTLKGKIEYKNTQLFEDLLTILRK